MGVKIRCSRCGSKRHASWRCAEIVRKCARCSNPNNTQHCHIVVMRTRLMKNFRDRYPSIIIQKLISLILNQHNYHSSVLCLGHTKVSLCTCVHPLSIELVDVTAQKLLMTQRCNIVYIAYFEPEDRSRISTTGLGIKCGSKFENKGTLLVEAIVCSLL